MFSQLNRILSEATVSELCNISNTGKSVSTDFQTPGSGLEKRGAAMFFETYFEVFGNGMKHSSKCLI